VYSNRSVCRPESPSVLIVVVCIGLPTCTNLAYGNTRFGRAANVDGWRVSVGGRTTPKLRNQRPLSTSATLRFRSLYHTFTSTACIFRGHGKASHAIALGVRLIGVKKIHVTSNTRLGQSNRNSTPLEKSERKTRTYTLSARCTRRSRRDCELLVRASKCR
jgi:hypothetical protein